MDLNQLPLRLGKESINNSAQLSLNSMAQLTLLIQNDKKLTGKHDQYHTQQPYKIKNKQACVKAAS